MGTRADFYVGVGENAEWIGSIAWDGYEVDECDDVNDPANAVRRATTESDYRSAVDRFLASREDATLPELGWPWPWDTSATTDYAYCFTGDEVVTHIFGGESFVNEAGEKDSKAKREDWPEMSERMNVAAGNRSGIIILTQLR